MKKRSKMAVLLLAASVLAAPGVPFAPAHVYAYDGKSDLDIIPFPDDMRKLLVELRDDYVPALSELHVDSIGTGSKSETIISLSDRKNVITAGVSLELVVDADGNITSLELKGADRDKSKKWDKKQSYQKLSDFIREQVPVSHVIAAQPMLSTDRRSQLDQLAVVSFYPLLNDVWVKKEMGRAFIDASGQIVQFHQEKIKLPLASEVADPKKAIPLEKAKREWENQLRMQLVYDAAAGKLVYEPTELPVIDAVTGEVVPAVYSKESEVLKLKGSADNSIWGDRKKMEQWLEATFKLRVNTLTFQAPSEKAKKRDTDLYEWNARMYQSASVLVDRKTKSLIEFRLDGSAEKELEKPLQAEEAKALALEFAEKHLLTKEQSFVVRKTRQLDNLPGWADQNLVRPIYSYAFFPHSNDIPAKTPLFTVEVDAKKGTVVAAKVNEIPAMPATIDQSGVIGEEKAKQAFVQSMVLRLAYDYPKVGGQTATTPQLVYLPTADTEAMQVDAATGEVVDSWIEWTASY